jgi:hypothetical protein
MTFEISWRKNIEALLQWSVQNFKPWE